MSTVSTVPPATRATYRNPLRLLALVIQAGFFATLAAAAFFVGRVVFFSGDAYGWNRGSACVDVPSSLPVREHYGPLMASVTSTVSGTRFCLNDASPREALQSTLVHAPASVLFLIAFGLAARLLGVATREGVYSSPVVRTMRLLGWTLLFGEVAVVALRVVGSVPLYHQLAGYYDSTFWRPFWQVDWSVLLVGVCLVAFARITQEGVRMREDLEGTV